MRSLEDVLEECKDYINNPDYVYIKIPYCKHHTYDRPCLASDMWLVVMKKLPGTKTNEIREGVVDPNYALFRADRLQVEQIINLCDNKVKTASVKTVYYSTSTYDDIDEEFPISIYTIGTTVISNEFDKRSNQIRGIVKEKCVGINYFKTLEAAYYDLTCGAYYVNAYHPSRLFVVGKNYWITRDVNGKKQSEGKYTDGYKIGPWIHYSKDMIEIGGYNRLGKIGVWMGYYDDSSTRYTRYYRDDGNLDGTETQFYRDGSKYQERHYVDGKNDGTYCKWHENGQLMTKRYRSDDLKYIKRESFYDNGKLRICGTYYNGKKHDRWQHFDNNGTMIEEYQYHNGEQFGHWKKENEEVKD